MFPVIGFQFNAWYHEVYSLKINPHYYRLMNYIVFISPVNRELAGTAKNTKDQAKKRIHLFGRNGSRRRGRAHLRALFATAPSPFGRVRQDLKKKL